jgi:hypothetical protein
VLAANDVCCVASGSLAPTVDRTGACCPSGRLDACGVCDGSAKLVDSSGKCCSSGVTDGAGVCCDGTLDSCGVCNGDDHSCAIAVGMTLPFPAPSTDSLDPAYTAYLAGVAAYFADLIGVDAAAVTVTPVITPGRRLADSNETHFDIVIAPATSSSETESTITATTLQTTLGQSRCGDCTNAAVTGMCLVCAVLMTHNACMCALPGSSAASVTTEGVCGNGVCESGEACISSSDSCCLMDCPQRVYSCPAPSFSTTMCGGPYRGICLTSGGVCDCFAASGFAGDDCGSCANGWVPDPSRTGYCIPSPASGSRT